MIKISLNELDEAKKNPLAFRAKLDNPKPKIMKPSIYTSLRNAIFNFHKTTNYSTGMDYLESHLESFKDRKKCLSAIDQFQWYVIEYQKFHLPLIQTRLNISVPLSTQYADSLKITGQISRLDYNLDGGFVAWLFRSKGGDEWIRELRMPIIQNAVAVHMGELLKSQVLVGIVSFEEQFIDTHEFSEAEVASAHNELETILRKMGY